MAACYAYVPSSENLIRPMPSVRRISSFTSSYGNRPLHNVRVTASFVTTSAHLETLNDLGAEVRYCSPGNFSTRDDFWALKEQYPREFWKSIERALDWSYGVGPNMIADDGGDITLFLQEGVKAERMYRETGQLPDPHSSTDDPSLQMLRSVIRDGLVTNPSRYRGMVKTLTGVSQITETGAVRVLKMRDDGTVFEPLSIYDSHTKTEFDSRYGSRLPLPEALNMAIGGQIENKNVVLCGYGDVGKNCANVLKEAGAQVFVIENNLDRARYARADGIQVVTLDDIVSMGDIFIITTDNNKDTITVQHMKKMTNNALICSAGFDNVIDMQGLETYPHVRMITVSPQAKKWVFSETNNGVIVLDDGRMMNLGGATEQPSLVTPCPYTDQVIGLIELWKQNGVRRYA